MTPLPGEELKVLLLWGLIYMSLHKNIDLTLLHVFICIVEEGSFTAAADRLDITQQAISAQVKRLEMLARRQLMKRTAHGVALTVDGEAMLAYARQIAAISERIQNQFATTPLAGKVRVGRSPGFPFCALAAVLNYVRVADPQIEISIETSSTAKLINSFNSARLDVVFGAQRPGDGRGEVLFRDVVQWVGCKSTVIAPHEPVPLIVFPAPAVIRDVMLDSLSRSNQTWKIALESEDLNSISTAIASGWGVSAMNELMLSSNSVEFVTLKGKGLPDLGEMEFFLRYDDRNEPYIKTFVDGIRTLTKGGVLTHLAAWKEPVAKIGNFKTAERQQQTNVIAQRGTD